MPPGSTPDPSRVWTAETPPGPTGLSADLPARRGATRSPRSLRAEFLINLALLATAALVLALWTGSLVHPVVPRLSTAALLTLLVAVDVAIFCALADYLLRRNVVRPLAGTVEIAEAIAAGEYDRRLPHGGSAEIAALSDALNRLTDQLLSNQQKLADNVRSLDETNRLLHDAQRELVQSEKMASIGRLAAGVAHEIGNPLGAVLGYASVLAKRGGDPELVGGIEREARRIDRIVRELLDYARPAALAREPVDVNASIRHVVELLRDRGHIGAVQFELDLEADVPPISAVQHRVEQVFVNLFNNSIAAMEGEGTVRVVSRRERYVPERRIPARRADDPPGVDYSHLRRMRHASTRESSRLEADREVVHVVVADTGPGIPRESIDSVFDPFFTTKSPGDGTGLGLAIVASTVSEMGGRIDASSVSGGGATFHLYLPLQESPS